MKNEIQKLLAAGRYAVVESTTVALPDHPVTLSAVRNAIDRVHRDLNKTTVQAEEVLTVCEITGKFTMKMVVPAYETGLFGEDLEGAGKDLEQNEMNEAEAKANLLAQASIEAIDHGNAIAIEESKEPIPLEKLAQWIGGERHIDVIRNVIDRANGERRELIFPSCKKAIGGNLGIPTIAVSEQTFHLQNVRIVDAVKFPYMELLCETEPPAELRLLLSPKTGCFPLYAGEESDWLHLLRFARAAGISMNVDVSVCEKIKTGQRALLVVKVHDPEKIISSLHQQLDGIAQIIKPL